MGIESLIPIGASIIGGAMSSRGAQKGAEISADATREGIAENRRQYDTTREDYRPYRESGIRGLTQYESELSQPVTAADVMQDPGYQFGMQQGQQALDRKIAASGGRVSGAALKAATRFGTDYGSTGYGAAYQRRQDRLNRLAALAGLGQTATGGSAAAGAASTNAITALIGNQGDTNAASRMAQGNIWGNTINQVAALYGRQKASDPISSFYYGGNTGSGD